MSLKTIKESASCKIYFEYEQEEIKSVIKEFSSSEAIDKEYEININLELSLKARKDGMSLIYPYMTPLSSKISMPTPEPEALRLMNQGCAILKDLKSNGIIHRDIKPGNLYLDDNSKLYINDFETAISENTTNSEKTCGTPGFMAPEQYLSPNSSWLADQYSMGAVFFCILTGTLPFSGDSMETIRDKQLKSSPDPSLVNQKLKAPFTQLIMKMMSSNKEDRFQSIQEIESTLEKCKESLKRTEILEDKVEKIEPKKKVEPKPNNIILMTVTLILSVVLISILLKSF